MIAHAVATTAGSGLLASASLLPEKGGPLEPSWNNLHASRETGGQGMVGAVRTALLTPATGPDARVDAAATLRTGVDDTDRDCTRCGAGCWNASSANPLGSEHIWPANWLPTPRRWGCRQSSRSRNRSRERRTAEPPDRPLL